MRPTLELPNCASGMLASPSIAQGMLVAHSNSSPQMPVDELMDIAQILHQLPGLAERRRDQFDQRFGKIRGDVFVGQRRAQGLRMARLGNLTRRANPQRLLFHALAAAAQYRPFAGIDESGKPPFEISIHDVAQPIL